MLLFLKLCCFSCLLKMSRMIHDQLSSIMQHQGETCLIQVGSNDISSEFNLSVLSHTHSKHFS